MTTEAEQPKDRTHTNAN